MEPSLKEYFRVQCPVYGDLSGVYSENCMFVPTFVLVRQVSCGVRCAREESARKSVGD